MRGKGRGIDYLEVLIEPERVRGEKSARAIHLRQDRDVFVRNT